MSTYGESQVVSSRPERDEGARGVFAASAATCSAIRSAAEKARSAGSDVRREFLLREADAVAHTGGCGSYGWRGIARHGRMVRPRLDQADALWHSQSSD